jgi:dephospho-CoA kinase
MMRNNLSEAEAVKRIRAQLPQEEKKRYADFLIDTSGGFENTRRRTIEVFEQLKLLT